MKTEEGNKLIAEFMGGNHLIDYLSDVSPEKKLCQYHSDWNLLMPVVEKIEEVCFATIEIGHMSCIIKHNDPEKTSTARFGKPKIKMVYEAILAYIEWYKTSPLYNSQIAINSKKEKV